MKNPKYKVGQELILANGMGLPMKVRITKICISKKIGYELESYDKIFPMYLSEQVLEKVFFKGTTLDHCTSQI